MRVTSTKSSRLTLNRIGFSIAVMVFAFCFALASAPVEAQDQGAPDSVKLVLSPTSLIGTTPVSRLTAFQFYPDLIQWRLGRSFT